jgi:hypothetical protein
LEPGVGIIHDRDRLKVFRAKDGDDQVNETSEGDQTDEDGFHDGRTVEKRNAYGSAHFFAENGVSRAEDEKGHGDGDKDEIVHGS